MTDWYDSSGPIAERTNVVINGVLDWADKTGHEKVSRKNLETAIRELTPVDGEDTVDQYVRRVVKHGPFESTSTGTTWRITDEVQDSRGDGP